MPKPKQLNRAEKIKALIAAKRRGQRAYDEVNRLFNELQAEVQIPYEYKLPDGSVFRIIDPFVDDNGNPKRVVRPAVVGRYDWDVK
jgi:hypothetical protein